jgi:hypothetical protein
MTYTRGLLYVTKALIHSVRMFGNFCFQNVFIGYDDSLAERTNSENFKYHIYPCTILEVLY